MGRTAAALLAAIAVLVTQATLSAAAVRTVRVEPEPVFALPPASLGCGGASSVNGVTHLPVTVSEVAGQVAESVNLCFGSRGPYPFILDTGSGQSTIDAGLASRLHLAQVGPPTEFEGVGCSGTARTVTAASWSVEGVPLVAQSLISAHLPQIGGRGQPDGLLGSDVLSRFGAVRLDFTAQTLTLDGAESPRPPSNAVVHGPTGAPPSAALTGGAPSTTVPLTVVLQPGAVSMDVRLRFGRSAARVFAVDTGSSQSVVATSLATSEHLGHTNVAQRQSTVCSNITVPLVHSGPWSIPGVSLHQQLIGATAFGPIGAGGVSGLIGSDQLIRFGWVVFDYLGGRLLLG